MTATHGRFNVSPGGASLHLT